MSLLVKLTHKGIDEFVQKYATNISEGGLFIRTRDPKPIGTELSFKVDIADGQRVLQGIGLVKWTRADGDPNGPAGMGLEFLELDPASRALVDRMVGKASALAAPPPPLPVRGAPSLADELFGDIGSPSAVAAPPPLDEDEPFNPAAAFQAPPPPPVRAPEPILELDVELEVAPARPGSEVDLDLSALLATTPAPPEDDEIPIDAEPLDAEPLDVVPIEHELPTMVRARPEPVPAVPQAPVVLQAPVAAPAPVIDRPKGGPVFLKDVKPGDGTGPVIGIDLGTTNSACAVLTKGRPMILSSKDGYNTIPSIVALTAQGKLQVGHRARAQMVLNPTQSIFGAKRLVGREFDSATVRQVKERSHFAIVEGVDRRAGVKLGNDTVALEEIQGLILKECRDMAEQALGVPVSRAVVTCPAYYSEPQREAVRRAGAMAGLKVERVLNEPTAAALAFGMNRELTKTVLVYDLGGGTFDATLLRWDKNVFEVLATGGDVFLGGVDLDNQLVDLLLQRFSDWHKRPFSGDRVALSRVSEVAEKMKIALSERNTFDVHLPMLEMDAGGKPLDLRTTVTRADIEAACSELIDRTIQAVQDVLLDAKLKASEVDDIILVGGMSRMPLVREKLKDLFKKPAHASVNADEAVALGAALYTGTVDKVSSLVLIDVVPMTIGLGKPGGGFHRLIERNTPLPATKSFGVTTEKHDETEIEVMIFQGEDSNVAGNEFLGAVTISGLPKGPAGSVQVAVTVGLDAECVLRVEAREFRTRKVVRSTLATRYTSDEISAKLGISQAKREEVNKSRGEELEKRAGGFWGKLKKLFGR